MVRSSRGEQLIVAATSKAETSESQQRQQHSARLGPGAPSWLTEVCGAPGTRAQPQQYQRRRLRPHDAPSSDAQKSEGLRLHPSDASRPHQHVSVPFLHPAPRSPTPAAETCKRHPELSGAGSSSAEAGAPSSPESKRQRTADNSAPPVIGLPNRGQTCYQASALQALAACASLQRSIADAVEDQSSRKTSSVALLHALNRMLTLLRSPPAKRFNRSEQSASAHNALLAALKELGSRFSTVTVQHDAEEFLSYLLDSINTPTAVDRVVQIQHFTQRRCSSCDWNGDAVLTPSRQLILSANSPPTSGSDTWCLNRLLEDHFASETLDDAFCPMCGGSCERLTRIAHQPRTLIVQIRRHRHALEESTVSGQKQVTIRKESAPLSIPKELDLGEHSISGSDADAETVRAARVERVNGVAVQSREKSCKASARYTLRAVVYHRGESYQSGHYTCTRRLESGEGYVLDDTTCYKTTEDMSVPSSQAYLLFYEHEYI